MLVFLLACLFGSVQLGEAIDIGGLVSWASDIVPLCYVTRIPSLLAVYIVIVWYVRGNLYGTSRRSAWHEGNKLKTSQCADNYLAACDPNEGCKHGSAMAGKGSPHGYVHRPDALARRHVKLVPGHKGIAGNEAADAYA